MKSHLSVLLLSYSERCRRCPRLSLSRPCLSVASSCTCIPATVHSTQAGRLISRTTPASYPRRRSEIVTRRCRVSFVDVSADWRPTCVCRASPGVEPKDRSRATTSSRPSRCCYLLLLNGNHRYRAVPSSPAVDLGQD